jgi:hypothetical protein
MEPKKPIRLEDLGAQDALRQLPFTVPDSYFDTLPSRVQAKALQPPRRLSLGWSWGRTAATLAGAGLVAALVWVTYPQQQQSLGPELLSEVSDQTIREYLEEQNITLEELADMTAEKTALPGDTTLLQYLDVSPRAIEQQLNDEVLINEAI